MQCLRLAAGHLQWGVPLLINESMNQWICGWRHLDQRQEELFVVTRHTFRRPGVTPPLSLAQNHQGPYENFQATWDGLPQDTFRNSMPRCMHVTLANMATWQHTERHYFCMCSSINIICPYQSKCYCSCRIELQCDTSFCVKLFFWWWVYFRVKLMV